MLKSVPETMLSAHEEVKRRAAGEYTDLGTPMPELFTAIKVDLTRHTADLVACLQKQAAYAFDHHLDSAPGDEWTSVTGFDFVKKVVVMLNAVAFVGTDLSRDQYWQEAAANYSSDVAVACRSLQSYPAWMRRFVHPFIFEKLGFNQRRRSTAAMLRPRITLAKFNEPGTTLIEFVKARLGPERGYDLDLMARIQLRAALASTESMSQVLTSALFDLAARPEYVIPLRKEIEAHVPHDGEWNIKMLRSLSKLDSFVKESNRAHPLYLRKLSCFFLQVSV